MWGDDYEAPRVTCPVCKDDHKVNEVEASDIEEDYMGRDVVTFTCPVKGERARALVWRNR